MRRRDLAGGAQVADVARPHLQHQEPGGRVGAQHGQRQPELVVEGAEGRDGRARPSASTWASRSLVLVLPWEPVSADHADVGQAGRATCRASRPSAATGSSTTTPGRPVSREDSTAAAPAVDRRRRRSRGRRRARRRPRRTARRARRPGCRRRPARSTGTPRVVDDGAADDVGDLGQGHRDHRRGQLLAQHDAVVEGVHGAVRPPGRSRGPCPPPRRCRRAGACATASRIAARRSPTSCTSARSASGTGGGAGEHLGADRRGVLAARVVVGDHQHVGEPGRDLAHQRPLAGVAVAAGADHDDQPPGGERAQARQRGRRRRRACGRSPRRPGSPGRRRPARAGRARRPTRPSPRPAPAASKPSLAEGGDRAERVGDVEVAGQRHPRRERLARRAGAP